MSKLKAAAELVEKYPKTATLIVDTAMALIFAWGVTGLVGSMKKKIDSLPTPGDDKYTLTMTPKQ